MLFRVKQIFLTLFRYHCVIVRLKTSYKPHNYKISLFLLLIGLGSFFIRLDMYDTLQNQPILLVIIQMIGVAYIIFLTFNTGCRLIYLFFKGIPFFMGKWSVHNIKYYLIFFIIYNLTFSFTAILLVCKLHSFFYSILEIYMFYILFYFTIIVSLILLILYLKSNFRKNHFTLDESKLSQYTHIDMVLFLALLITIFVNINNLPGFKKILAFFFNYQVIHCDSEDLYERKIIEYYNKESF